MKRIYVIHDKTNPDCPMNNGGVLCDCTDTSDRSSFESGIGQPNNEMELPEGEGRFNETAG